MTDTTIPRLEIGKVYANYMPNINSMFRQKDKVPSIELNLTSIDNEDTQSVGFMSKNDKFAVT